MIKMRHSCSILWVLAIVFLSRSSGHVLDYLTRDPVCPTRTAYNMELRNNLVGVEKAIREAVHSVTEQIISCPDDSSQTPGRSCINSSE